MLLNPLQLQIDRTVFSFYKLCFTENCNGFANYGRFFASLFAEKHKYECINPVQCMRENVLGSHMYNCQYAIDLILLFFYFFVATIKVLQQRLDISSYL